MYYVSSFSIMMLIVECAYAGRTLSSAKESAVICHSIFLKSQAIGTLTRIATYYGHANITQTEELW